jgi:hypothetical protein
MSQEHGINLNGGALFFEGGPPIELADKIANALPYPMMKRESTGPQLRQH